MARRERLSRGGAGLAAVHGRVSLNVRASGGPPPRRLLVLAAVSAAGLVVCAGAVLVTLSGTNADNPALEAQLRAVLIAAPIAVGLFVLYRAPWTRFAKLLIFAGFAWSLSTLAQSDSSLLYSTGRVAAWF